MFIDPYLDAVKDTAQFLDTQLAKLGDKAAFADDPDLSGELERAEYLTGLGFVALQQYMTCVFAGKDINRAVALDSGPRHECDATFATLVNSAANYWKHCSEWEGANPERARADQSSMPLKRLGVSLDQSYVLADVLLRLMQPNPARFRLLIPFLERWRNDVVSKLAQ